MLYFQTVDAKVLELLTKLMKAECFSQLRLVGGTALALQIGHRQSIDIDLFGTLEADEYKISNVLRTFGTFSIIKKTENINIFLVNGVKVDLVNYPYSWIDDALIEDGIRIAGRKDIAAMKLAAIAGRGSKKDFIDMFFLLKEYSLAEMLGFYTTKFQDGSEMLVLKSLTYFEDAETEETPRMMVPFNWETVKETIASTVRKI